MVETTSKWNRRGVASREIAAAWARGAAAPRTPGARGSPLCGGSPRRGGCHGGRPRGGAPEGRRHSSGRWRRRPCAACERVVGIFASEGPARRCLSEEWTPQSSHSKQHTARSMQQCNSVLSESRARAACACACARPHRRRRCAWPAAARSSELRRAQRMQHGGRPAQVTGAEGRPPWTDPGGRLRFTGGPSHSSHHTEAIAQALNPTPALAPASRSIRNAPSSLRCPPPPPP